MIKRIVIAGCRNFKDYEQASEYIDICITEIRKRYSLVFVSGGCQGADIIGEKYAKENGFAIEKILPDWQKYGRAAGPIRNEEMAKAADYVICFWDGKSRGTKSMIGFAKKHKKPLKVKMI